jgi:hypothetical protein
MEIEAASAFLQTLSDAEREAVLFGRQYDWIAIIGTPSGTDPWQWGGHHVTTNATIAGSNVSLTPSFIGCQPCEYTDARGNTVRPLGQQITLPLTLRLSV